MGSQLKPEARSQASFTNYKPASGLRIKKNIWCVFGSIVSHRRLTSHPLLEGIWRNLDKFGEICERVNSIFSHIRWISAAFLPAELPLWISLLCWQLAPRTKWRQCSSHLPCLRHFCHQACSSTAPRSCTPSLLYVQVFISNKVFMWSSVWRKTWPDSNSTYFIYI